MSRSIVPEPVARLPWNVILPLTALVFFGSSVLYSAAGGSLKPWATTHVLRYAVFLTLALVMSRVPREMFRMLAYPVYGGVLILLILVEMLGAIGGGSQRWLDLGFMTLQPSELMKPAIILVLARFYEALPPTLTASWRGLVPAGVLTGIPALLVMLQPDLGTALAICFGGVTVMFLAGLPVAQVVSVDRESDTFALVVCEPVAGVERTTQVLVLGRAEPPPPRPAESAVQPKQRG